MNTPRSISLPERMDASALLAVQAEIMACRGDDLDLDASGIRRFGGLALQLILAASRTWCCDGFCLRLLNPAPSVRDAVEGLGCTPHIKSHEVAA
ncbi:MAG: STAS domain-containing protein [Brevundimonas sp.]|jgi:chemotaxis protein CheX